MTKSETVSRQIDVLAIGLLGLAVGALTVGMAQVGQIPEVAHLAVGLLAFYHAIDSLSQAYTGAAMVPLGPPMLQHRARRNTQVELTVAPEVN